MFNRSTALMLVAGSLGLAPGVAAANCQCLANGRAYARGEIACLKPPGASYLARCDIELNNTSWKKIRDGCPESMDTKTLDGPPASNAVPTGASHGSLTPDIRPKGAASSPSAPEIADHC